MVGSSCSSERQNISNFEFTATYRLWVRSISHRREWCSNSSTLVQRQWRILFGPFGPWAHRFSSAKGKNINFIQEYPTVRGIHSPSSKAKRYIRVPLRQCVLNKITPQIPQNYKREGRSLTGAETTRRYALPLFSCVVLSHVPSAIFSSVLFCHTVFGDLFLCLFLCEPVAWF